MSAGNFLYFCLNVEIANVPTSPLVSFPFAFYKFFFFTVFIWYSGFAITASIHNSVLFVMEWLLIYLNLVTWCLSHWKTSCLFSPHQSRFKSDVLVVIS